MVERSQQAARPVVEVKTRTREFVRRLLAALAAWSGSRVAVVKPTCHTCNTRQVVDLGTVQATECGPCLASSIADDKSYARAAL